MKKGGVMGGKWKVHYEHLTESFETESAARKRAEALRKEGFIVWIGKVIGRIWEP